MFVTSQETKSKGSKSLTEEINHSRRSLRVYGDDVINLDSIVIARQKHSLLRSSCLDDASTLYSVFSGRAWLDTLLCCHCDEDRLITHG